LQKYFVAARQIGVSSYVHKFKLQTVQYLMAYRFVGEDLGLAMIGPHENYYRDLKSYLKAR